LFQYTIPDGPNEQSKEIILAAQFTNNLVAIERGNRMHLYVGTWYEDMPGLDRDIANDRPWRRLTPTNFTYDVFDRENDSRFYNPSNLPIWPMLQAEHPSVTQPCFRCKQPGGANCKRCNQHMEV